MDVIDDKQRDFLQSDLIVKDDSETDAIEWTEEEENKLVRNGNALTDNFFQDVGITQNQFNVGQQLLSLGIILLEVPPNTPFYRDSA
ncbi:hypothetical protein NW762_012699 [Fusarium torreyae]|uniref:Uncharacterized protein n=1 Tax=Fusarium torreyae TaxID=1237075 RepID=A0A9W8V9A9_9HYPO|nr:hypothetical protein NW762_012699 [Fusarium torreyae]